MDKKEKWIAESLNSLDKIQKADLPFQLKEKILSESSGKGRIIYIRPVIKWAAAAIIIMLIGANLFSIVHYQNKKLFTQNNPFYQEYFSFLNNI
jgi:hypothetical protein